MSGTNPFRCPTLVVQSPCPARRETKLTQNRQEASRLKVVKQNSSSRETNMTYFRNRGDGNGVRTDSNGRGNTAKIGTQSDSDERRPPQDVVRFEVVQNRMQTSQHQHGGPRHFVWSRLGSTRHLPLQPRHRDQSCIGQSYRL